MNTEGAKAWRQHCAQRLQTLYRGYRARRQYRLLLRKHYLQDGGDPRRRREFLGDEAATRAGKLAAACDTRETAIDR